MAKENNMLNKYSDEDLQQELKHRKKRRAEKPVELITQDFTNLRKCCQEYINGLAKNQVVHIDQEHWIFEAAMEAVFGKKVWEYINNF